MKLPQGRQDLSGHCGKQRFHMVLQIPLGDGQ